jgi:hypothetical protein
MKPSYNGRLWRGCLSLLRNDRRLRNAHFCAVLARATGHKHTEKQQIRVQLSFVLENHGTSMFIAEAGCYGRDGFRAGESKAAGIDSCEPSSGLLHMRAK